MTSAEMELLAEEDIQKLVNTVEEKLCEYDITEWGWKIVWIPEPAPIRRRLKVAVPSRPTGDWILGIQFIAQLRKTIPSEDLENAVEGASSVFDYKLGELFREMEDRVDGTQKHVFRAAHHIEMRSELVKEPAMEQKGFVFLEPNATPTSPTLEDDAAGLVAHGAFSHGSGPAKHPTALEPNDGQLSPHPVPVSDDSSSSSDSDADQKEQLGDSESREIDKTAQCLSTKSVRKGSILYCTKQLKEETWGTSLTVGVDDACQVIEDDPDGEGEVIVYWCEQKVEADIHPKFLTDFPASIVNRSKHLGKGSFGDAELFTGQSPDGDDMCVSKFFERHSSYTMYAHIRNHREAIDKFINGNEKLDPQIWSYANAKELIISAKIKTLQDKRCDPRFSYLVSLREVRLEKPPKKKRRANAKHRGNANIEMEACLGGDLYEYLLLSRRRSNKGGFSPFQSISYLLQMTLGLQALHANGCFHSDIKPGNAVLKSTGQLKLCDFGLAKHVSNEPLASTDRRRSVVGTRHYMSGEIEKNETYSSAADVYALGATLYQIVTGEKAPYYFHNVDDSYKRLHQERIRCAESHDGIYNQSCSRCTISLLRRQEGFSYSVSSLSDLIRHNKNLRSEWKTCTNDRRNMELLIWHLMHPIEEKRLKLDDLWAPRFYLGKWMDGIIKKEFEEREPQIVDRESYQKELLKPNPSPTVFCDQDTYNNVQEIVAEVIDGLMP